MEIICTATKKKQFLNNNPTEKDISQIIDFNYLKWLRSDLKKKLLWRYKQNQF